ncbi:conserved hypothetical protein [Thiomonas sp. X19]|uniref:ChaN family lipoprotein n=1 Tax=Thiomonas sp. X19 TaxID=1050370 RepID=UPI000B6CC137|nr:ChaN family lipoprotein [Thiomonas sp. X19]SCC91293.1 conserved hypothetical protein [Thiomonas sp. X19]
MSKPRLPARHRSGPVHDARRRTLVLGLGASGLALSQPGAWAVEPALPPLPAFQETGFADSPLVGRIVGADGLALQPAQLLAQCAAASICMLGEQHDHPDHHALQAWVIQALAARGQLAAVALEMVDAGRRFDGPADAAPGNAEPPQVSLAPTGGGSAGRAWGRSPGNAGPPQVSLTPAGGGSASRPWGRSENGVRQALHWNNDGWPWALYVGPVMAAVRAGIPVVGVNLPDAEMMNAYRDPKWDASVPEAVRRSVIDDVRDSHCGLLPAAQLPAMARIQFARDASMAAGCVALLQPRRTVVLLAGSFHADKTVGIALHLAAAGPVAHGTKLPSVFSLLLQGVDGDTAPRPPSGFDAVWFTPSTPPVDHCAALRKSLADKAGKP